MANNDLWKPDKETVSSIKLCKQKLKKRAKRSKIRREKQKTKVKMRDGLLTHFKLNKYATNIAICFCIHKETGASIPGKDNDLWKMMSDYWSIVRSGKARPGQQYKKKQLTDEEFYSSKKWRELRYVVLSMSNGACCLCGATAKDGVKIHVDHIKPRSKYPELEYDLDNLQPMCSDCNLGKSNYDDRDWRLLM